MEASISTADPVVIAPPVSSSALICELSHGVTNVKTRVAQEFMALAEVLQANSRRARQLTAASHQATGSKTNQRSTQSITVLQDILDDSPAITAMVEISTQKISEILARVHALGSPLRRLTKMSTLLQIVSVLCRIEGGRLTSGLADIVTLSQDIDALAGQIEGHIDSILADASALFTSLQTGVNELDRVGKQGRLGATNLIDQTQALLGPARLRSEASQLAARTIDEQYAAFHRATDKVVMSLQAEDLARQRLEHVEEALRRTIASLDSGSSIASCAPVLALQRAQLAGTRDLLTGAAQSIRTGLESLDPRTRELVSQTTTLARQTDDDGQALAALIESGLETVAKVFRQCSSSAAAVVSIVDRVIPPVEQMTTRACALESIEISIRLISLNATVKTAQLGNEGAAMDVLASELHAITTERSEDTSAILSDLKLIGDALASIHLGRSATHTSTILNPGSAEAIATELSALAMTIRSSSQQMARGLEEVEHLSTVLCLDLARGAEIAVRAEALSDAFDALLANFDETFEHLGIMSDMSAPSPAPQTEDLSRLYSMQSERELHAQVFGDASDDSDATLPPAPSSAPSEFGDDVELF